jgi:hypothetical protein
MSNLHSKSDQGGSGLAVDLPKVANCDPLICMRALKLDYAWLER